MNQKKTRLLAIFFFIDEVAEEKLNRKLSEDEKALAHGAIHQAWELSERVNIPYATAFEKLLPNLPAWEDFQMVYQIVREKRGRIEKILVEKPTREPAKEIGILPLIRRARQLQAAGPLIGLSLSLVS